MQKKQPQDEPNEAAGTGESGTPYEPESTARSSHQRAPDTTEALPTMVPDIQNDLSGYRKRPEPTASRDNIDEGEPHTVSFHFQASEHEFGDLLSRLHTARAQIELAKMAAQDGLPPFPPSTIVAAAAAAGMFVATTFLAVAGAQFVAIPGSLLASLLTFLLLKTIGHRRVATINAIQARAALLDNLLQKSISDVSAARRSDVQENGHMPLPASDRAQ